ncbi:hypothetical protein RMATCC62417_05599 [Rhizopus microsporus]|nr:hypothetical protein RMATCC62417_05599 [Rhizopus microsporus]
MYKKVQELSYKKHNEQKKSIKLWLKDLQQQRGYFIYIAQDFEQSYTFGFVSLWQRQQLIRAESFCLESMHWSAACQTQMFTNMETNNYIGSWHNQLRANYLQRRLDRLIFILVDDVHTNFMRNTARMAANIGHMSSETREARKRVVTV